MQALKHEPSLGMLLVARVAGFVGLTVFMGWLVCSIYALGVRHEWQGFLDFPRLYFLSAFLAGYVVLGILPLVRTLRLMAQGGVWPTTAAGFRHWESTPEGRVTVRLSTMTWWHPLGILFVLGLPGLLILTPWFQITEAWRDSPLFVLAAYEMFIACIAAPLLCLGAWSTQTGRYDIILDFRAGTLTFPGQDNPRRQIPLDTVHHFEVHRSLMELRFVVILRNCVPLSSIGFSSLATGMDMDTARMLTLVDWLNNRLVANGFAQGPLEAPEGSLLPALLQNKDYIRSALYQQFLLEREEVLKLREAESARQGHDIGWEKALLDWIVNHRDTWRKQQQ